MDEEIVWFDFSRYGYSGPIPVDSSTSARIMSQAEDMINNDPAVYDNWHMDKWLDFLTKHSIPDSAEWRILCLLHMAVEGLTGRQEPSLFSFK